MLTPRWYQTEANDAVWTYLSEKQGNPVVVLPTGAGKSLLIAILIQQALEFGGRVVVLAHRKELLQQNADEIRGLIPGVDVGIYSAGLKSRQIENAVVVAGIQSVFRKAADLGRRHLVLVDEAHLISGLEETMYRTFLTGIMDLTGIMEANEGLRIVGLTATPFRTGTGPICGPDRIFQRIVFEAQTGQLIAEGFLCPITNKAAEAEVNTEKVGLRGGEFIESEMQAAFDTDDNVDAACLEILKKCEGRHSVLVFASGVHHAEQIAKTLTAMLWATPGEVVAVVTGETMPIERAEILRRFIAQELRFVVNVDVLTTGFNAKCVDAIAILRATMSPGLFCQMVGRGLRLHPSKTNCLLLDFGGNIARHGSIDDPNFGYSEGRPGSKRAAVAAQNGRGKECPACGLDVSANSRTCPECGFLFPFNHNATADEESQLTGEMPPETWQVVDVHFKRHTKKGDPDAPPTVRADYVVKQPEAEGNLSTKVISEWVCPEHQGFARKIFCAWWDARSICDFPDTVEDALSLIADGVCRVPVTITTKRDGKYTRIISCDFGDREKPTELKLVEEARVYSGDEDDVPF